MVQQRIAVYTYTTAVHTYTTAQKVAFNEAPRSSARLHHATAQNSTAQHNTAQHNTTVEYTRVLCPLNPKINVVGVSNQCLNPCLNRRRLQRTFKSVSQSIAGPLNPKTVVSNEGLKSMSQSLPQSMSHPCPALSSHQVRGRVPWWKSRAACSC